MKILISDAFHPSLPEKLARFGEVTDDKSRLPEMDVVLVRSKTKCTKEYIEGAPNLKLIIRGGVGLDNIDLAYAHSKGIQVYNTAEASAIAVAELAMALMVAVPTHLVQAHNSMVAGQWLKKELKRTELYGKTLGLVGAGNIGTEVARRAQGFGMKVIAYDPPLSSHDVVELVNDFDDFLARCDYISLHVPLMEATSGLIDADALGKMKDGAVLVNTARGGCIVEEAVADALERGKLAAYATDVWLSDPPDDSCPVLNAPNVLMTPHIGAGSKENMLRIGDVIVRILDEFADRTA